MGRRNAFLAIPHAGLLVLVAVALAGCPAVGRKPHRDGGPVDGGGEGGDDGEVGVDGDSAFDTSYGCDRRVDKDGDGIPDIRETTQDTDGDGTPNDEDIDSDADGVLDEDELNSPDPCVPGDSDADLIFDFLDVDSDNDGLEDGIEASLGSDPTEVDSDRDGFSDLIEVAGGTDPTNGSDSIDPSDFALVLPYESEAVLKTLRFRTDIELADVFFLVDRTGSMGGERTNLIQGITDIVVPGIADEIEDVQFGVGGLDDYPMGGYGSGYDQPFYMLRDIGPADADLGEWSIPGATATSPPDDHAVNDIGQIEGSPNGEADLLEAVEGLPQHYGADDPESYVPALWSMATGLGLSWPTDPAVELADKVCPHGPDAPAPIGYPCFRPRAQPIVLLIGDNFFHNGPSGYPYTEVPDAPGYDDAVTALTGIGARVVGIYSTTDTGVRDDFRQIAEDTGAVTEAGDPLVYRIEDNGSGLSTTVVDGVVDLVGSTPQNVTAVPVNVDGNPDDFDATEFITAIRAVEGWRDGNPGTGYASKTGGVFYGVIPGTLVDFAVTFQNLVRPGGSVAQVFRAEILVLGSDVAQLDTRHVYIVVPPAGRTVVLT